MEPVLCVGIDPAPKKGAAIVRMMVKGNAIVPYWDGKTDPQVNIGHVQLRCLLENWKNDPSVLIAWDAPLTGPAKPDCRRSGGPDSGSAFTMRRIEEALRSRHPPKGISVQPYSGCSHWAITRNLFGLPRVGPYDCQWKDLHYQLLGTETTSKRPRIVEVHPAVAIWFWLSQSSDHLLTQKDADCLLKEKDGLKYKSNQKKRRKVVESLIKVWKQIPVLCDVDIPLDAFVQSDDLLDAFIAAVLAAMLALRHQGVCIYGDLASGAMLLPFHPDFGIPQRTADERDCGCGETTKGGHYLPGHDSKHKSALVQAALGGSKRAETTLEQLGWAKFLDAKRSLLARQEAPSASDAAEPTTRRRTRRTRTPEAEVNETDEAAT
jgi:hypothetical protein